MIAAGMGLVLSLLPGFGILPGSLPAVSIGPDTSCIVMDMPTEGRLSPLDSLTFAVGGSPVKICYGRPSARGRTMIGGPDVPFGKLWRTGANEPTMIHTTAPIGVAGIEVQRGSYSLYTVPGEDEWIVIVNRSITQWGHIAQYTYKVKAQEVGKASVPRERLDDHVETMTFRAEPAADGAATLVLEWELTRVRIPITPAGS
ncbi:MAG: DUF2911 domain-containing protein [Gemmatimonadota bacterium]|nr:MAG: DUF2911 domain-containing protein [Gemmatimonadota bacterium]